MVVPSLDFPEEALDKVELRRTLRAARREHAAAVPDNVRALLFRRPPRAVEDLVPEGATVAVYREMAEEAPATGYARWLYERGNRIALPFFERRGAPMEFRRWHNPFHDEELERGQLGILQPAADAEEVIPAVLFVPLVGFTPSGGRLGMGAGHYDRWLSEHPGVLAIGLAWDCQETTELPIEAHDRPLHAVVTPTRVLGPFQ